MSARRVRSPGGPFFVRQYNAEAMVLAGRPNGSFNFAAYLALMECRIAFALAERAAPQAEPTEADPDAP